MNLYLLENTKPSTSKFKILAAVVTANSSLDAMYTYPEKDTLVSFNSASKRWEMTLNSRLVDCTEFWCLPHDVKVTPLGSALSPKSETIITSYHEIS